MRVHRFALLLAPYLDRFISRILLLMIEILHDLTHNSHRKYGIMAYMGSRRIFGINSIAAVGDQVLLLGSMFSGALKKRLWCRAGFAE